MGEKSFITLAKEKARQQLQLLEAELQAQVRHFKNWYL
jgi:hypothetical protein